MCDATSRKTSPSGLDGAAAMIGRPSPSAPRMRGSSGTEHRHVELAEHLDTAAHVRKRNVLRRRADHRTRHRHALREAELHVSGPGREIDDQVVELTPRDLIEELAQGLGK